MYKWYKCRARDMGIYKPEGIMLTFHVGGKSKGDVRATLISKGMKDIEYINCLLYTSPSPRDS